MKKKEVPNWLEEFEGLKEYMDNDIERLRSVNDRIEDLCTRSKEAPDTFIGFELGKIYSDLGLVMMQMLEELNNNKN